MKKFVIIAAFMAATLGASAQHTADTLATLQDLRNVGSEMARINKGLKTHSVMVASGGVLTLFGMFAMGKGNTPAQAEQYGKTGKTLVTVGAALIAASFIPMPKNVKFDERGVVIPLGKKDKRK